MTTALRSDAGGALSAIQVNGLDQFILNASGLLQAAQPGGTAAQFDASLALVTTAFLKRFGLQSSGVSLVNATSALTAAVAGGTVLLGASAATTQTLPALSAFPIGGRIEFMNAGTGTATIAQNGADTTGFVMNAGARPSTLSVAPGDTLTLAKVDVSGTGIFCWAAVGGSVQIGSSNGFALLKATPGYQRLPSGLIIQWLQGTFGGSGQQTLTPSLPIAFTQGIMIACVGLYENGNVADVPVAYRATGSSATTLAVYCNNAVAGATGYQAIVLGY